MIDITTKEPLQVSTDGGAGPYILLPLDQVKEVQQILVAHGIHHTVEEDAISMDDEPFIATIDLGRGADADAVQAILDSVH